MATEETVDEFARAREQAVENAAVDAAAITEIDKEVSELQAKPDAATSNNPSQVLVEDEAAETPAAPAPVVETPAVAPVVDAPVPDVKA